MNVSNKKLYYQFFDLYRLSSYEGDIAISLRAKTTAGIIRQHPDVDFCSSSIEMLKELGIDERSACELREYGANQHIAFIDEYKSRFNEWLKPIILPDFFTPEELRLIIKTNNISNAEQLLAVISSERYRSSNGVDKSELDTHFVRVMSGVDFPMAYRMMYSAEDDIVRSYKETPILGNLHNHSRYSDGRCSINELADLGGAAGRQYIGISDHTSSVGGVGEADIEIQHEEIERLNNSSAQIHILHGVECEILADGRLDLAASCLSALDYTIIAVHSYLRMNKKEAMQRIIKAIEHPQADILAHPSSRMYRKNAGLLLDMQQIIDACISNGVAIEINGDPDRLDLAPDNIRYALDKGALFTIDSDTHSPAGFRNINNAVRMATDCKVPPESILNLKSADEIQAIFRLKHPR